MLHLSFEESDLELFCQRLPEWLNRRIEPGALTKESLVSFIEHFGSHVFDLKQNVEDGGRRLGFGFFMRSSGLFRTT